MKVLRFFISCILAILHLALTFLQRYKYILKQQNISAEKCYNIFECWIYNKRDKGKEKGKDLFSLPSKY